MSRTFAYARVSTAEQVNSNQLAELTSAGFNIPASRFVEETISGSSPAMSRPGFAKLLDKLEAGDTLVVTKIDRIGRDSIDVQQTVQLFQSRRIRLIVLQLGNLDLTSTAGSLVVKVLAAMGDFERELIIERTLAGQARARAAGTHMGLPSKTTSAQKEAIRARLIAGAAVAAVAKEFIISRASVIAIRNAQ